MSNKICIDQSEKTTPIWADRIPVADSADNNNTLWSTTTNLATAIFLLKDSDDLSEGSTNLFYTSARSVLKLDKATYDNERTLFASSSTWTDAYAITDTTVSSYVDGKTYKIRADVANTWPATLEINSLWPIAIEKIISWAFTALITWDCIVNQIFWATYNATEWVFQYSVDLATTTVSDASTTNKGIVEKATTGEFITRTLDKYPDVLDLFTYYWLTIIGGTTYLLAEANTERAYTWTTWVYTKSKEIEIDHWWTYTVSFEWKESDINASKARIYKNGSPFGTEQDLNNSDVYATYAEDLTFTDWDTCELRVNNINVAATSTVKNFNVKYDYTDNRRIEFITWTVNTD